jgi:phage tail sheath gpL-like
LTAKHFGTVGNAVGLAASGSVAGLTVTLTGMSGGATDPSLTAAINAIQDKRYQIVVVPSGWDVTALKTELESRWVADNRVLDGQLFQAKTDSFANILAFGNAENSKHTTFLGFKKTTVSNEYDAPEYFALDYGVAAYVAGVIALRLTDGALIGDILASNVDAARDVFGGSHSASLPFHNTLVSTLNPSDKDGFTGTEIAQLDDAGVAVIGNNNADNAVVLGTMVTSYKTDNAGNPDDTFKYLNGKLTDSLSREIYFNNYKARYSQARLTRGAIKAGYIEANVPAIRAFCVEVYNTLSDLRLGEEGAEAVQFFRDNLVVEIQDFAAGKVFISMEYKRAGQVRQIDFTIQPNLEV